MSQPGAVEGGVKAKREEASSSNDVIITRDIYDGEGGGWYGHTQ